MTPNPEATPATACTATAARHTPLWVSPALHPETWHGERSVAAVFDPRHEPHFEAAMTGPGVDYLRPEACREGLHGWEVTEADVAKLKLFLDGEEVLYDPTERCAYVHHVRDPAGVLAYAADNLPDADVHHLCVATLRVGDRGTFDALCRAIIAEFAEAGEGTQVWVYPP